MPAPGQPMDERHVSQCRRIDAMLAKVLREPLAV
jgi:hypothetical protein